MQQIVLLTESIGAERLAEDGASLGQATEEPTMNIENTTIETLGRSCGCDYLRVEKEF